MKRTFLLKTLLLAVGLLTGANSWADDVASIDFNDQKTPFVISDANRLGVSYALQTGSQTDYYAKYSSGNMNGVAFAYYNFSTSVSDAATVTIDFDFYISEVAGHQLISIADASAHTASAGGFTGKSNTGYGVNGAIFNLGCFRGGGNNKFAINSVQNDLAGLGAWCHAQVVVDNADKKVNYSITKGEESLASAEGVAFLNASANRCSQIDLYIGTNATGNAIQIDNLVITKTVSENSHNYTINAKAGTTLLKELASGIANENAGYSVSVPKVIAKDGKYYVLNDGQAGMTMCLAEYTMGTTDETQVIQYTLDESVVFFKECEDIQQSYALATASGGYACSYYANPVTVAITQPGIYQLETNVTGRDGNSSLDVYTADGTEAVATFAKNSGTGVKTLEFSASGNMRIGGPYYNDRFNNSKSVDYLLVRILKTAATIGSYGYATFSSTYPLDFSNVTDLNAYIATGVNDGTVMLTQVTGAVPANTGLVIKGEANTYDIPVAASADEINGNLLVACAQDTEVEALIGATKYVMSVQEGKVVFARIGEDKATVAAGHAYLSVPITSARNQTLTIGDDASGIADVTVKGVKDGETYNLRGQRVSKPTKGVYIIDGSKVVIK